MIEKIKLEELIVFETLRHPIACAEILFHDFDDLGSFSENEYGKIRNYQFPFQSYIPLFLKDENLSKKENFNIKKGLGDIYALGGRLTGKTLCVLIIDVLIALFHKTFNWGVVSSFDALHIRGVMEKIITALDNHPILKLLKAHSLRGIYKITTNNGCLLESVNENLMGKNPGCVDKETEILTNYGWKFFKDLTYNDKVLSKNEIDEGFYVPIKKIISFNYKGKLKRLKSRTSEFLFTPNHNLLVLENKKEFFRRIDSAKLYDQIFMPSSFIWKGKKPRAVYLSGMVNGKYQKQKYDIKLWCRFIAWYLSEGSIFFTKDKHYRIDIPQKKNWKIIEKLLNDLKIHYTKTNDGCCYHYRITNKLIYYYLLQNFGKIKTKKIPKYFKDYDAYLLKIFIKEYLLGDGCIYKTKNKKYLHMSIFTSLKTLADDLQEVAQKAGYKTNLRKNYSDSRYGNPLLYVITLCLSKNTVFKKSLIEEINYNDKVYCVEAEPYHTILIRREGHVIWTGNSQWYQKHIDVEYAEESSFITQEVSAKKRKAISELGCVNRYSGMTTFTRNSPMGKIFDDLKNESKIINLPSYVNPNYDEETLEDDIKEFGGKNSTGFLVQVEGKVIESGDSVYDMQRIRETYKKKVNIKSFEISKDNFFRYKEILVLERLKNADTVMVALDKGEGSAPTEIIILFKINDIWHYTINVTNFKLAPDEDEEVIRYIIEQVKANVIAMDVTSGKALFCNISKLYPENTIPVAFNEKIDIDFEKDKKGKNKYDKHGNPIYKKEFIPNWSVHCLMQIFYNKEIKCLMDFKLDTQFNGVIVMQSGLRTIYKYKTANHLYQAFQVFAIADWQTKFKNIKPIEKRKLPMGIFRNN